MSRLTSIRPRLGAAPARIVAVPKRADPFYSSPEWRALVARRVGDPDWHEAKARAEPGERLILDHVVERRDGGAELDPANTMWRTFSEHQAKTAKERLKRSRGGR